MTPSKVIVISREAPCPAFERVVLGEGESLCLVMVVLPGVDAAIDLPVSLEGEGASLLLRGIYLCNGFQSVSLKTTVEHKASGTTSRQLFNGICAGASKAAFDGLVKVEQDAQKIKALQENHTLLLSDDARAETRPQLEIYADDVECSHGATIGKLNEEEQFYMRSRGIPEDEAKVLQMISFLASALEGIEDEALRQEIEAAVRSL